MAMWRKTCVSPDAPIMEAIRLLDETAAQICLIVDADDKLLGTVTDGDIRRGILRKLDLSAPLSLIMNPKPHTLGPHKSRTVALNMMESLHIHQIPVVDSAGKVIGLESLDKQYDDGVAHSNWVFLLAGGLGTRLQPLTDSVPKPMVSVGNKPILEIIIERLIKQNFRRFYISVNYKADIVKDHFGDGAKWNAEFHYLHEDRKLGTAGPLSLIPDLPEHPLLVMNADLLTQINFNSLITYHQNAGAAATMAVREYDFQIPYGVVEIDGGRITRIDEKPAHKVFVNAGIYVVEPEALAFVPKTTFFDMPDLFSRLIEAGKPTTVFPVREYWMDIGRHADLVKANSEFDAHFNLSDDKD